MSVDQLIAEIKLLPQDQQMQVVDAVLAEADDSWIPESFKKGMADFESGRFIDMETALTQPPPGRENEV
jgi:predicted transcriptional regulator